MKKYLALILALVMVFAAAEEAAPAEEAAEAPAEVAVMSYADFTAAAVDDPVCVETYVQAKQGWWEDKATVYTQDQDGAYFLYNMACSEADYAKLVPGQKIRVTGYKAEWSGEIEIVDASFELVDGDSFTATPVDVTELLGKDELLAHQNQLVSFKGMTVEAYDESGAAFAYKNEARHRRSGRLPLLVRGTEPPHHRCDRRRLIPTRFQKFGSDSPACRVPLTGITRPMCKTHMGLVLLSGAASRMDAYSFCFAPLYASASAASAAFFAATSDSGQSYSQFQGFFLVTPSAKGMKMDRRPNTARIQQYHMLPTRPAAEKVCPVVDAWVARLAATTSWAP